MIKEGSLDKHGKPNANTPASWATEQPDVSKQNNSSNGSECWIFNLDKEVV